MNHSITVIMIYVVNSERVKNKFSLIRASWVSFIMHLKILNRMNFVFNMPMRGAHYYGRFLPKSRLNEVFK